MTTPITPPALGAPITKETPIPEEGTHRAFVVDPATRWLIYDDDLPRVWNAVEGHLNNIPLLTLYAGTTTDAMLDMHYITDAGLPSVLPVNMVPYRQDFRHMLAHIAQDFVTHYHNHRIHHLLSPNTRRAHPNDVLTDAEAQPTQVLAEWVRCVVGSLWQNIDALDAIIFGSAPFTTALDALKARLALLDSSANGPDWVAKLHLTMDHSTHSDMLASTGQFNAVNADGSRGAVIVTRSPHGVTDDAFFNAVVPGFEAALRYYYAENQRQKQKPRRPIYIPEHFYAG